MKKVLQYMILVLIVVFAASSCDQDRGKLPDRNAKVSEYATINSLKSAFLALDRFQISDVAKATSAASYPVTPKPASAAFVWGMLSSETMFAGEAEDKTKLSSTAALLIQTAPLLALAEEAGEYGQRVKILIGQGNWKDLNILNSGLQSTVDMKLLDAQRYDFYTLSYLGAWTHTTNRLARLIGQDYDAKKSGILQQEDVWDNLLLNLELLSAEPLADAKVEVAIARVRELQEILNLANKDSYTLEQVNQIARITNDVETLFLK